MLETYRRRQSILTTSRLVIAISPNVASSLDVARSSGIASSSSVGTSPDDASPSLESTSSSKGHALFFSSASASKDTACCALRFEAAFLSRQLLQCLKNMSSPLSPEVILFLSSFAS